MALAALAGMFWVVVPAVVGDGPDVIRGLFATLGVRPGAVANRSHRGAKRPSGIVRSLLCGSRTSVRPPPSHGKATMEARPSVLST